MENVLSLHDHVIEVKLWDAKEKISSKARGDRPRAFRLPSETEIRFPGQGVKFVFFILLNFELVICKFFKSVRFDLFVVVYECDRFVNISLLSLRMLKSPFNSNK